MDFSNSAYYVDQCSRDDPEVNICLMHSANRLARLLQRGIPELGMEEVMYFNFKYTFFSILRRNVPLKQMLKHFSESKIPTLKHVKMLFVT